MFSGRAYRLVDGTFVESGTAGATSEAIIIDGPVQVQDVHNNLYVDIEDGLQRLDSMILLSRAWQEEIPLHKYTQALLTDIEMFQVKLVSTRSSLEIGERRSLRCVVALYREIRLRVKPMVSTVLDGAADFSSSDDDDDDDSSDKIILEKLDKDSKKRRITKKTADTTYAACD